MDEPGTSFCKTLSGPGVTVGRPGRELLPGFLPSRGWTRATGGGGQALLEKAQDFSETRRSDPSSALPGGVYLLSACSLSFIFSAVKLAELLGEMCAC